MKSFLYICLISSSFSYNANAIGNGVEAALNYSKRSLNSGETSELLDSLKVFSGGGNLKKSNFKIENRKATKEEKEEVSKIIENLGYRFGSEYIEPNEDSFDVLPLLNGDWFNGPNGKFIKHYYKKGIERRKKEVDDYKKEFDEILKFDLNNKIIDEYSRKIESVKRDGNFKRSDEELLSYIGDDVIKNLPMRIGWEGLKKVINQTDVREQYCLKNLAGYPRYSDKNYELARNALNNNENFDERSFLIKYSWFHITPEEEGFANSLMKIMRGWYGTGYGSIKLSKGEIGIKTEIGKKICDSFCDIETWKESLSRYIAKELNPSLDLELELSMDSIGYYPVKDHEKIEYLIDKYPTYISIYNLYYLMQENYFSKITSQTEMQEPIDFVGKLYDFIKKLAETQYPDKGWENDEKIEFDKKRLLWKKEEFDRIIKTILKTFEDLTPVTRKTMIEMKVPSKVIDLRTNDEITINDLIMLIRLVEYRVIDDEDIKKLWELILTKYNDEPFVNMNLIPRLLACDGLFTDCELIENYKKLSPKNRTLPSVLRAFFSYKNHFGLHLFSDEEIVNFLKVKEVNDGTDIGNVVNAAEVEISKNRPWLRQHMTNEISEQFKNNNDESIFGVDGIGFFESLSSVYKSNISSDLATNKIIEECYKYCMSKGELNEEARKALLGIYGQELRRIKEFLPSIVEIIEESKKGYDEFFREFEMHMNAKNNHIGKIDITNSCSPERYATYALINYCDAAEFYCTSAMIGAYAGKITDQERNMFKDTEHLFHNPVEIIKLLKEKKSIQETFNQILNKYELEKYGDYSNLFKEKLGKIVNWYSKIYKLGKIDHVEKKIKLNSEFFISLEKDMGLISWAFTEKDKRKHAISNALNRIQQHLSKDNNKNRDYIENKVSEIFANYGITKDNWGSIEKERTGSGKHTKVTYSLELEIQKIISQMVN